MMNDQKVWLLKFLLGVLILIFGIDMVMAQSQTIQEGDMVKIETKGYGGTQIVGKVMSLDPGFYLIKSDHDTHQVSIADIDQVWVSQGKKNNWDKGVLIGLLTGALTGGFIGATTYTECHSEELLGCLFLPESRGEAVALGMVVGGSLGIILGGLTGLTVETERWKEVNLQLLPSSIQQNGKQYVTAGIRISF